MRKGKHVYQIWCEWDVGEQWEYTIFETEELAQADIDNHDWEDMDYTLEEVQDDGLVAIEELWMVME